MNSTTRCAVSPIATWMRRSSFMGGHSIRRQPAQGSAFTTSRGAGVSAQPRRTVFRNLAKKIETWPQPGGANGQVQFFVERLIKYSSDSRGDGAVSNLATYDTVQQQSFDDLVTRHAPLVKRIAFHLMNRLPPSVQAEDLIQAGMIGLIERAEPRSPARGEFRNLCRHPHPRIDARRDPTL